MLTGRRLSLTLLGQVLANSGFGLLEVINVAGTQGFVCKRIAENEPAYLVLAFRGTEKKVSDWLTDVRCTPTVDGQSKVHTGFFEAFETETDSSGRTALQIVKALLAGPDANGNNGEPLPLFITGHSLGGALALVATRRLAPDVDGACYTFGAPRVGNYEYFRPIKTPVFRVVNSSDIVPRVPPGAPMNSFSSLSRASRR